MSGVSGVTAQLASMEPCSSANCCDRIDAMFGAIARLTARVQSLEDGIGSE